MGGRRTGFAMQAIVFDQVDPRARGQAHGELWREEIRELAEIRARLAVERGRMRDRSHVLEAARLHLRPLAEHAPDLHAELLGISEGSGVPPELVVVLNHYSDLRDLSGDAPLLEPGDAEGCTAIYFNGREGAVLGQTWDMHASAASYVRLLRIAPSDGRPEVVCLSLTGCLGIAGINASGVAVAVANLRSTDAALGVTWPAIVRAMLAEPSAAAAYGLLRRVPLTSGHHYMIADGSDFYGVETSGTLKVLTQTGARAAHLHTNHCFDPVLRRHEDVPRGSTTFDRLNLATTIYAQARPTTADDLWSLLHTHTDTRGSLCRHGDGDPDGPMTCGIVVMRLAEPWIRAVQGCDARDRPVEVALRRPVA